MTKSYSDDELKVNLWPTFPDAWRRASQAGLFGLCWARNGVRSVFWLLSLKTWP